VPVLDLKEQAQHDAQQRALQGNRRNRGLPLRDFESGIFTVPKPDGGHRLCTDCRALNTFQVKSKFQLDGTKAIAQLVQPGDFGALATQKTTTWSLGCTLLIANIVGFGTQTEIDGSGARCLLGCRKRLIYAQEFSVPSSRF
jgi:hypothetical protein